MNHKKQHLVPSSYIATWCDPDTPTKQTPYVWRFTKNGSRSEKKAPKNIFTQTDAYTIKEPDGTRNLILEKGLCELETRFAQLRDKKVAQRIPLNEEDRFLLCAFMATMMSRTASQREYHREQWGQVLKNLNEMIEQKRKDDPEAKIVLDRLPENQKNGKTLTYEDVKEIVNNPLQNTMLPIAMVFLAVFLKMDMAVIETDDVPGLITSDNPCVWDDRKWQELPPFLQDKPVIRESVEISLPISPRQLVFLNWKDVTGYIQIDERIVNEANARTRFNAHEYFVVSKNMKRPEWFME